MNRHSRSIFFYAGLLLTAGTSAQTFAAIRPQPQASAPAPGFYEHDLAACRKALAPDAMGLANQYARKGSVALNSEQSKACGTEFRAVSALSRNSAFRYQVYQDLPGLTPGQALWVSELGGWFDQMTQDATSAFSCGQVKPVYISLLQQLDIPLAIASMATKGVPPDKARALSQQLLTRVGDMLRTVPPGSCKTDYRKDVQSYGQEMELFLHGKSHWAYGCSATFAYGQTTLRCPPQALPSPSPKR